MSIPPLNNVNSTSLVPTSLLGYTTNGQSAIQITPTSIILGGDLTTTPIYVEVSASTGLTTNRVGGLNINCDLDMNNNDITEIATLKFNTGMNISDASTTAQITSSNGGLLSLVSANDLLLDVNNDSKVELTPTTLTLTGNGTTGILMTASSSDINITASNGNTIINSTGIQLNASDYIQMTATNDNMSLQADDDIILTSVAKGIILNAGNGDAGNNDITLTTQNSTLVGAINLNSGGDITLSAPNGGVINLNSGDNVQATCGENFFVNTNSTTGIVSFATGDLANSGVVRWNNYPMSMSFFHKWNGSFSYPQTGTNVWDIVRTDTITFPSQFLYGTWSVNFGINCWNVGSAPSDKGLACYIDFIDGNSNTYEGFNYRQSTPFANWFNASGYTASSQNPMSISMIDYFDFSSAVNNLEIRLWWYGDQSQNQEFNISTQFTLMTLI